MNRSRYIQRGVLILLPIVVLALIIYYYTKHREDFQLITTVSVGPILIISLLKLVRMYCRSLELKILTDHYNLNLSFSQWFGLSRVTAFSNLFLPSGGGASLKAVYLKKCHDLRYSSFVALTGIATILKLMVFAMFSIALLLLSRRTELLLFLVSGLFIVVPLALLVLSPVLFLFC